MKSISISSISDKAFSFIILLMAASLFIIPVLVSWAKEAKDTKPNVELITSYGNIEIFRYTSPEGLKTDFAVNAKETITFLRQY